MRIAGTAAFSLALALILLGAWVLGALSSPSAKADPPASCASTSAIPPDASAGVSNDITPALAFAFGLVATGTLFCRRKYRTRQ